MKKTVFLSVCVLLLCGGLFCLHLTAQPERAGNAPAVSLLEMNFDEVSERQLLEMKVDAYQKLLDWVNVAYLEGVTGMMELADAQAKLAAAQIELYRHTGEQDKLFAALQERVDALSKKLQSATVVLLETSRRGMFSTVVETEIELLDALLEQKRTRAEGRL